MTRSPNHIRAALRLGTVLAVLALSSVSASADDLIDYGGDYTDQVVPPEPLQTGYRVGRGYATGEDMTIVVARDRPATFEASESNTPSGAEHH